MNCMFAASPRRALLWIDFNTTNFSTPNNSARTLSVTCAGLAVVPPYLIRSKMPGCSFNALNTLIPTPRRLSSRPVSWSTIVLYSSMILIGSELSSENLMNWFVDAEPATPVTSFPHTPALKKLLANILSWWMFLCSAIAFVLCCFVLAVDGPCLRCTSVCLIMLIDIRI